MADPHVTTGTIIGASISPSFMLLGAHADALIVGLIAAAFATFWLESVDSKIKSGSAVMLSSLLAGYGSPVAVAYASASVPAIASTGDVLRLLCAAVIGVLVTALLPASVNVFKKKIGA